MDSAMETDELLPCPFCGGEAEVWSHHYEKDITLWQVRCSIRPYEVETACYASESFISFDTEEEAIEAWNTRAERTFPDEVQEAQHHLFELERITGETWRPDRTCTIVDHFNDGPHAEDDDEYHLSCGHMEIGREPEYCPECGAKVVE